MSTSPDTMARVNTAPSGATDIGGPALNHDSSGSELRLSLGRVLRSEWIKFRTLKSNLILLATTVLAMVAFGLMAAATASGDVSTPNGAPPISNSDPVTIVLSGATFAVLLIGVLGVLIGAREYSSGLIRVSLAAVPARLPVLWAKIGVFLAVALPAMLVAVLLAFYGGNAVLANAGLDSASLSDSGVLRAVLGTAGYLMGIGIIGISLGVLLRSIAGGLATLLGGVLILPELASVLLPDSWDSVLKYLPSNAGSAFTSVVESGDALSPLVGGLVFLGWVVVSVAGAAIVLKRRDA